MALTRNVVRSGVTRDVTRGVTDAFFSGLTPTLHYDFVTDKSLVARIGPTLTYTRTGDTATRINSSGNLEDVLANVARFDHDLSGNSLGILVEEARTNLCLYSEDLSNAAWVVSNVTKGSDSVTTPRGTSSTTVRLTASAGNGTCLQSITSASANRAYAVYMKRVTGTGNIDLTLDGGSTWTTKTLTSDWQRFNITQSSVTNPQVGVRIVTSGDAIDFFGSDLQSGTSYHDGPTSYIPTTSTSVTRNVENVTATTSVLNDTSGTIYVYGGIQHASKTSTVFLAISKDFNEEHRLGYASNLSSRAETYTLDTSAVSLGVVNNAGEAGDTPRIVLGYEASNYQAYIDGTAATMSGTEASAPTALDTINVGHGDFGNAQTNGHIKEVRYYDSRLPDATLQDMSNGVF